MKDLSFECTSKTCFGNQNGWCRILMGATKTQPCPFFKTQEQFDADKERAKKRSLRVVR